MDKDPYKFGFLGIGDEAQEREIEKEFEGVDNDYNH